MLIRKECFGNLIWSDTEKRYFVVKNNENDLERILNKAKNINEEMYKELVLMGLDDNLRILEPNSSVLSAPLEYYYDYTNACNLQCSHCYNRDFLNCDTMNEEQIEYVIRDMYENGVMRLHLAGGEPTLYPHNLKKYMSVAKELGIVTSMSSNGTTFSDEIGNILIENDVTSFTVSIESADEEKNAKIRGKGVLNQSIEGIKKVVDFRNKNNGKFNISIKMSYDTDTTRQDFERMIKLAIDLKVDILKLINPERCVFHERGYYSNVAEKYYHVQEIIRDLKEEYKDSIIITIVNSPVNLFCEVGLPNMKGCIGAQELVAINPDGSVTPCLMNKYDLGNIFIDKSIKEIYQGQKIAKYKEMISDYQCNDCKYHSQCRGGCQVRKIVEYGKITSIDPLCPIKYTKNTKEIVEEKQKYKYFKVINNYHAL